MDRRATRAIGISIASVGVLVFLYTTTGADDEPSATPARSQPSALEMIGGCPKLPADAPDIWTGKPASEGVNIRVGPGTEYEMHESGSLASFETVFVLQECEGWLQGRVMSLENVRNFGYRDVPATRTRERADQMLTFWVRVDLITR